MSLVPLLLLLAASLEPWTVQRLFTRPYLWGTSPSQLAWAKHKHKLGFLWNAGGGSFRDLYVYDSDSRQLKRLTDLENSTFTEGDAEADPNRKNFLPPQAGVTSFELSDDGSQAVLACRGDLFLVSTDGTRTRRLTRTKATETNPVFSPDGQLVAFSEGGQIYLLNLATNELDERSDIKPPLTLTGFHWSPDGLHILYSVRVKAGRSLPLPNYSGRFVTANTFSRDVAGDQPVNAEHYLLETTTEEPARLLDTGKGFGSRPPVWSEDSRYLALLVRKPDYKSQELRVINVQSGKSTVVYQQSDDRWVENADYGWDPASHYLWFTSDASGYQHLYKVKPDGTGLAQLTHGNWEIHNDPFSHSPQWIGDSIYYSSTQAGTAERQFYRINADHPGEPERLTQSEGLHIVWLSHDGAARAQLEADLQHPFDLTVDGQHVTTSPLPGFRNGPWVESRFLQYPSRTDRKPVAARLLLPPGYNPDDLNAKPRPAVVYIHGSGYATSVLKQWGSYQDLRFVFNNYLASAGYPVLEMDYRGSTNYGRDWRSGVYLDMGGPDLQDVLGGIDYLRGLKNIDMQHIGIWGWSYGGFMTSMALFRAPGVFHAGAAFSGVYDWENYNANYTGERLTTPAENPEAYRRSSPLYFSQQLRDHLLVLHGMADDNVLFQDAVQLTEKLIAEHKPFEEAFFPEENHAYVRDETLQSAFQRVADFFSTHLQ